jgi:general stress protein 26
MEPALRDRIIAILEGANDMTIATIRDDGYPQATTVSYVNDGLIVYFGCSVSSQKASNIARNHKVSLAINLPYSNWGEICGLSLGGTASRVTDPKEMEKVRKLVFKKFMQVAQYASSGSVDVAVFRVTPTVLSILDYRKGIGHTELIKV